MKSELKRLRIFKRNNNTNFKVVVDKDGDLQHCCVENDDLYEVVEVDVEEGEEMARYRKVVVVVSTHLEKKVELFCLVVLLL